MCVHFDEIVTAQYPMEESIVLFLPASGEVLLCDANDWRTLRRDQTASTLDLARKLRTLGVLAD